MNSIPKIVLFMSTTCGITSNIIKISTKRHNKPYPVAKFKQHWTYL